MIALILFTLLTTAASAQQQQPSCEDWLAIANAVAAERNMTQELHVKAEARAAALERENAALKEKIKELEKPKP